DHIGPGICSDLSLEDKLTTAKGGRVNTVWRLRHNTLGSPSRDWGLAIRGEPEDSANDTEN
ncbi:MAG: hypothetical protein KC964_14665, partial [Candidatus Omnitrophica bacterium]|nr:hypothetical protein [Candidatus Omnitrophota bacterium]